MAYLPNPLLCGAPPCLTICGGPFFSFAAVALCFTSAACEELCSAEAAGSAAGDGSAAPRQPQPHDGADARQRHLKPQPRHPAGAKGSSNSCSSAQPDQVTVHLPRSCGEASSHHRCSNILLFWGGNA